MTQTRILFICHGNSDEGVGRICPKRGKTLQNAAGKKEITTVLLLLVKFCRKYENQRHMKKRWPLKIQGLSVFQQ